VVDTARDIAIKYENQLPKTGRFSLGGLFAVLSGAASILGLVLSGSLSDDIQALVYSGFLCFLFMILVGYIFYREKKKLHRYALATHYVHYVNHLVRDELVRASKGKSEDLEDTTAKILDAIANCYSLLTGKKCRASLKDFNINDSNQRVVKSAARSTGGMSDDHEHLISENTDFENVYFGKNGCSRYYLCNNLKKAYLMNEYKNSSFEISGYPERKNFVLFSWISSWSLKYNSALVLPIRHINSYIPPGSEDDHEKVKENWHIWGFLCIDCSSAGVFKQDFDPELGGACADALYTLFTQSLSLINLHKLRVAIEQNKAKRAEANSRAKVKKRKVVENV